MVIDGNIYRLEHLLPSGARKGNTAITQLPPLGQDKRKHDLKAILELASPTLISAPAQVRQRPRKRKRPEDSPPPPPPPPSAPLPPGDPSAPLPPMHDLMPFMTTLSEHFATTDVNKIIRKAMGLSVRAWERVTGVRPWWVTGMPG